MFEPELGILQLIVLPSMESFAARIFKIQQNLCKTATLNRTKNWGFFLQD